LTLATANFAGVVGKAITVDGASKGNTVDTAALSGSDRVTVVGGAGKDVFTGGAGNDVFKFSRADLAATDKVKGGAGSNELLMTTAGRVAAGGISGVEIYKLANGGKNTLTLAAANFAGVVGKVITVDGGNKGNTISEQAVAAADRVVMKGGAGADTLIAGPNAVMTGGAGADRFELTEKGTGKTPDTNTIADFHHDTDKLALSKAGFSLGSSPKRATLFTANASGKFTTTAQRFAYDTGNGHLYYDAHGDAHGSSRQLIATLAGHPTLTVGDITFAA
ncbi:MAG: M10 family metallopeptidase C-terminal domain-containing protein, partial [Stellaceae bacterium]